MFHFVNPGRIPSRFPSAGEEIDSVPTMPLDESIRNRIRRSAGLEIRL
jgi:hypothetical protein